ncbi:MAG: GNAT family N-acetyltransferase [bacterium]
MWRVEIVDRSVTEALRRSVLRPHLTADQPMPGDDRPEAVHFAAFAADHEPGDRGAGEPGRPDDDDRPASTCFLVREAPPWDSADIGAWHLRQMATDPAHRRQGAGVAVLDSVVAHVAAAGGGRVWCHARTVAEGFYAAHGFVTVSGIHPSGDPPVPHIHMDRTVEPARRQPIGDPISSNW